MRINSLIGLCLIALATTAFAFAEPPERNRERGQNNSREGQRGRGGPPEERGRGQGGPPEGRRGPMGPPAIIKALDANSDGEISTEEMEAATQVLKKLDKNGDGVLTPDEFAHPGAGKPPQRDGEGQHRRGGPRDGEGRGKGQGRGPGEGGPPRDGKRPGPEEFFKRFDTNEDGKISKDEAPGRMKENFDQIDANDDGQIDKGELQKMMEKMRGGRGDSQRGNRPDGNRRPGGPPKGDRPQPPEKE